jgi:hypothetical protein
LRRLGSRRLGGLEVAEEFGDARVRLESRALNKSLVDPVMLERTCQVALSGEGAHDAERRFRVEGISDGKSTPQFDRASCISSLGSLQGQALRRSRKPVSQVGAHPLSPALELRRILEVKVFEKLSPVDIDGGLQVSALERRLEIANIGRDQGGIQSDGFAVGEEKVGTLEVAAEGVECLLEYVACPLRGALRPEI